MGVSSVLPGADSWWVYGIHIRVKVATMHFIRHSADRQAKGFGVCDSLRMLGRRTHMSGFPFLYAPKARLICWCARERGPVSLLQRRKLYCASRRVGPTSRAGDDEHGATDTL